MRRATLKNISRWVIITVRGSRSLASGSGEVLPRWGLSAVVGKDDFLKLCENRHPQTGERLTARHKDTRQKDDGGEVANRRVFFDFTFSPPKSVSIAALVANDERV